MICSVRISFCLRVRLALLATSELPRLRRVQGTILKVLTYPCRPRDSDTPRFMKGTILVTQL